MRTNGVDERFCTGKDTTDWEKFEKWAETVPYTFRNPLYHWTHLELKTAFGIDKILNPHTAREVYDECNEKLKQPGYSARGMMRRYHVEVFVLQMILLIPWNTISRHVRAALKSRCCLLGVRIRQWRWKFLPIFALYRKVSRSERCGYFQL